MCHCILESFFHCLTFGELAVKFNTELENVVHPWLDEGVLLIQTLVRLLIDRVEAEDVLGFALDKHLSDLQALLNGKGYDFDSARPIWLIELLQLSNPQFLADPELFTFLDDKSLRVDHV